MVALFYDVVAERAVAAGAFRENMAIYQTVDGAINGGETEGLVFFAEFRKKLFDSELGFEFFDFAFDELFLLGFVWVAHGLNGYSDFRVAVGLFRYYF